MGAPKQKWTPEEEEALRAGVAKHGTGKWKNIQKDPEFEQCLAARSNIDLKDKWRNLSVSASGQGSRDKFKSPKLKALPAPPVANSNASSLPTAQDATADVAMDPSKGPVDKWRNLSVSASGQVSRDKFKSPKLKALPAPLVANSNTFSSLPAAQHATADVAMDPLKGPVDGWRSLSVSASSQGSRDKFKSPKLKALPAPLVVKALPAPPVVKALPAPPVVKALPAPLVANSNGWTSLPVAQNATTDVAVDPSKSPVDSKTGPRYNELKFEAVSTLKDLNASDTRAISSFIERTEVPQNLRELSLTPRRLVNQGEPEKVQNSGRIKKDGASGQKMSTTPKPEEDQHLKQSQTPTARTLDDEMEEATIHTANLVAEAENTSFLASEAVKESERIAKMLEDSEAVLLFANEIRERCSRGEVVSMA